MRGRNLAAAKTAAAALIGPDELLLALALALVTVGLWPWAGRGALVLPGLVLLWVVLPSRRPFIATPTDDKSTRRTA